MRFGLPERPCGNETINTCSLCRVTPGRPSFIASTMDHRSAYQPTFSNPDADAVLSSLDGTLYRLPSSVLRRTTTFFASSSFTFGPDGESIPIHEHDVILERLLRIISGLAIPPWRTFDELEGVLSLAETWGARGALDIVRASITAPVFLREPLRVYAIATRLGWEEEVALASKHTLSLSLNDEQHQEALQRIPTRSLVKLFKFHRKRRDEFQKGMEWDARCGGCDRSVDGSVWVALVWKMFWDMDARPSGDRLCSLEIEEWPEMEACLSEKCPGCGRFVYDRLEVLERVRKCLAELPDTV
ncbi:uncharacterized protein EV420DRAFT_736563 [Desarmillaria tabescens]|uniref:BTB domain-containing protein n=1 Tax=Armillaria tabescens TaxID=1929756 RepID=A0AA39JXM3_ARMTA|nr:uncharacterized protein EV420DRAFT_736563 [Desarmillaria tabescens]KAK0450462.1 hypothetical protein EV420DRAFT_736563 [Desarmillaria tabescens]